MDKEHEEMQSLGVFGIYKEAYKIIFSWRKIFSQITLALILPLCLIFLDHVQVSDILFGKIVHNEIDLEATQAGTPKYNRLSHLISSEWTTFYLFKFAYFTLLLVFSLLSTSAVVYTIACVYTSQEAVTFHKVLSVIPKVWKRLMVTFLWSFIVVFAYNVGAMIVLIGTLYTMSSTYTADLVLVIVLVVIYLVGFVYLGLVWQLACVVSVLEDAKGFEAMKRSKQLIKGKMEVAILIFSKHAISVLMLEFAFKRLVVYGWSLGMVDRVVYGVICLLVLLKLILFWLVTQTILYFVCKSYHHEIIEKSALLNHLQVYLLRDYVPLKTKDVQLEQFDVI